MGLREQAGFIGPSTGISRQKFDKMQMCACPTIPAGKAVVLCAMINGSNSSVQLNKRNSACELWHQSPEVETPKDVSPVIYM